MSQRFRVDGDNFENAPRVDADLFYTDKKDAFSKISGYVWTGPKSPLIQFIHTKKFKICNPSATFKPARPKMVSG